MTGLPGGFRTRYIKARALELIAKDDMVMIDAEMMTVQRAHVSFKSIADMAVGSQEEVPPAQAEEIRKKVIKEVAEQIAPEKNNGSGKKTDGYADAFKPDMVNHPPHYTSHPSGVECIQVTEHMNFCLGNAIKYLWRADSKGATIEDLKKARWYLDREIQLREVKDARPPSLSK